MDEWLSQKSLRYERSIILVLVCIMVYGIIFSATTVSRHHAFMTGAWDLGIFTQSLWTTLNANRFFYHTCELFINPSGSFFGVHFSPILFLILPLYWISQTPETLLVLQSFILPLAAIPIYKLARENAGGRVVGLVFALAYLTYPPIHYVNCYDFHVQAFLPLFFACTIYYVTKENWPKYLLFLFLSLMCQENVAQIGVFIGVYIGWKYRGLIVRTVKMRKLTEKKILVPVATMILSIAWYWITVWQRNTFFPINPQTIEAFLGSGNFEILGAKNPLEVPLLVVLRPWNAILALTYDASTKILYMILIFGPLALFSFKSASALIPTIPWFFFSLFSQCLVHHMLGSHYEAYTVSFVFAAAIFGLRKSYLKTRDFKSIRRPLETIAVFSLVFFVTATPLFPMIRVFPANYTPSHIGEHERLLDEVLDNVPSDASILTQSNLFPHVSHRIDAYVIPSPWINSPIRNVTIEFINQTLDKVEYVLVDHKSDPAATAFVLSLLDTKTQFIQVACKDNGTILLYKRQT